MKFTKREIKDLIIAWFVISIAFAILFSGYNSILTYSFFLKFIFSGITVGIGFLFHELMHKYFAQKYGLPAEFYAFYPMLLFALLFSFFGFIFAAPGAVVINGRTTKEKSGKISLAGPMTNIVLAIIFLIPSLIFSKGIIKTFLIQGISINSFLALFNLVPFRPFDGKDVYDWSKIIYIITVLLSIVLLFVSYIL
jgi:Zn-dependent protease